MKLNIKELTIAANDAATKAVNIPNAMHDGFDGERLKAFARLIVERCAVAAEEANAWRGGHGDPGLLSGRELGNVIRSLLEDK